MKMIRGQTPHPVCGKPYPFSSRITMQHKLAHEHDLVQIMSGAEMAPDDPGVESTAQQKAAFKRNQQGLEHKNGGLLAPVCDEITP